jgi:hypothetical protein
MMEPLDKQDYEELIALVVRAQAIEIVDSMLIENSPSNRLISLKQLEMKLIGLQDAKLVFDFKARAKKKEEAGWI